ncbi:protein yellow-like [Liolophura sinensis]|uniref:protein yellow-like n=1 Tax=Liolophura sinensis TaxID=3198878 RepID=UPI003157F968
MWFACILWTCITVAVFTADDPGPSAEVVYEWVSLDYDWPNDTTKVDYTAARKYIKENNIIAGVKVYKDDVYVTVPRWREGVPSSLNKVVMKNGKPILQPFPAWKSQTVGDCDALQYVQSMEVDPNRGWMWIIDVGRINTNPAKGSAPQNLCPAKLMIFDINKHSFVKRYDFPATVVSPTTNFLNDIVVDYVDGRPRYAYITDTSRDNPGLVVYDFYNNTSHRFTHVLAMTSETSAQNITINNITYVINAPIDGIALSPDSKFLYFCPLAAYSLYQVSTAVVRDPLADFGAAVHKVGRKVAQTDGMAYGQNNLYFGVLSLNGVYKWEIGEDAKVMQTYDKIEMKTQTPVVLDTVGMQWVDTFAFDQSGYLWFTANRLQPFFHGTLDFTDTASSANMRIWKVFVGEKGYLDHSISASNSLFISNTFLFVTVKLIFIYFLNICVL